MSKFSQTDIEAIVKQARKEYEAGLDFRHLAEKRWKLAEDQYFNRNQKTLKMRYNVPLPIVPGFVETLLSKIDDPPTLKFGPIEEADLKAANKATALYEAESNYQDYDWDLLDLDGKKQAILYGRTIFQYYAESKPEYKSNLELVDVYDFIADPLGGGNLEKHRFYGIDNLFKTREQLKDGAADGDYDKAAVEKIINATKADVLVDNDNKYRSKQSRMTALGADGLTYNYAGQSLYKFIQMGTTWKSERVHLLFNYETGTAIVCDPLKERFKSGLWPVTSWATHREVFNFWNKAPVDDVVPLAEMAKTLVNQELDNRQKKNWGMRAYDPEVFAEPGQLEWRPDGLVKMKSGTSRLQRVDTALYTFETPELRGTIDLVGWIDNILGQKSGVTADTQGQSKEDKVGIYYGNVQQVADRLGLYNKSYSKCWTAIGRRYVWGLWEHLREPQAVQIIGADGHKWDELARTEIQTGWDIKVEGGNAQMQADEVKKKNRLEIINTLTPAELAVANPKWLLTQRLKIGDFDDGEVKMALDTQGTDNKELMSEAAMAIQDMVKAKTPKPNRGANSEFLQKLLDWATDNTDDDYALYARIMAYIEICKPFVIQNMARKAVLTSAANGTPILPAQQANMPPPVGAPAANTLPGTASQSQKLTNNVAVA